MFNWNLYILDPFFIILGIFFLALLFRREKEQRNHLVFYLETLLIWIVNFVLAKNFTTKLDNADQWSSTVLIILSFFASTTLLTILLKPLATWVTGLIHHRRVWMWAAIGTSLVALIISHCYSQTSFPILATVVVSILIALALASQSLYYLYTNEQFYYRMFPVFTSIKIGSLIALASFIGSFVFGLNHTVQGYWYPTPNLNNHVLFSFCYVLIVTSFGLSFYKKEDSTYVRTFEVELQKTLQPFTKKILFSLIWLAVLWGLMFGLMQSKVLDFYFVANLRSSNYSPERIGSLYSLFKDIYWLPTFIFGYFFYNYVYKHLDTFQTTFMLSLMMGLIAVLAAFTRSWVIILLANFFFGLILSQMFYLLFGFAMMWNYRAPNIPVTGIVASSALTGTFVVEVVVVVLRTLKIGIFADFQSVGQIAVAQDLTDYVWMTNGSASIVFAFLFVVILIYALMTLIFFKPIAAEYLNLTTINKLEELDRQMMLEKLKSKIEL